MIQTAFIRLMLVVHLFSTKGHAVCSPFDCTSRLTTERYCDTGLRIVGLSVQLQVSPTTCVCGETFYFMGTFVIAAWGCRATFLVCADPELPIVPCNLTITTDGSETTTEDATTTDDILSIPTTGACVCACNSAWNTTDGLTVEERIEKMKIDMTIDRTTTGAFQRKLNSATYDSLFARGMGYTSISIILLVALTLVLFDIRSYKEGYFRTRGGSSKHK